MNKVALSGWEQELKDAAWDEFSSAYEELLCSEDRDLQSREERLMVRLREVGRRMLQRWVQEQGIGDVGPLVETTDGQRLTHRRPRERSLTTVFGPVQVHRMGYGQRSVRSVYPLEKQCAIPEDHYSYALQKLACREAVQHCYDDAAKTLDTYLGVRVPKRQMLSLVHQVAQQVDSFYAQHQPAVSSSGDVVVMTMDGKGLVMRSADLRAETRRKQAALTYKHRHRLSKGEKPYRKRIATVASVYHLERKRRSAADVMAEFRRHKPKERPRARDKRVWANVQDEVRTVADQVVAEAEARLGPSAPVVFISDGDHRMRQPMQAALADSTHPALRPAKVTFIVDLIHAVERLWTAAFSLFGEGSAEVDPWVDRQLRVLLEGRAVQVAATIRRAATRGKLKGARLKKVARAANYLRKYKDHMRYDQYLRKGYPIASGVIEGACKHVIKDRCERSGARWSLVGADSLLKLRSVWLSDHWDEFWAFYTRQDQARRWAHLRWKPQTHRPILRVIDGGKPSS